MQRADDGALAHLQPVQRLQRPLDQLHRQAQLRSQQRQVGQQPEPEPLVAAQHPQLDRACRWEHHPPPAGRAAALQIEVLDDAHRSGWQLQHLLAPALGAPAQRRRTPRAHRGGMHHLLGRRGALTPTEAVRSPLPWATLAARRGGGFEAGHALAWIVPIPLLQLLLQVADAGFQLRDVRLLLGDQCQRLL